MMVHRIEAGEGEPVLLLHGFPQSASCWRHQIPALAADHRVVAVDWPGFGRSAPPSTPPDYDNEVERIDELADMFGFDRFSLIAHDYGGLLALGYTQRHPGRVLRLALLNTRGHAVFRPWFHRFSLAQRALVTRCPGVVRRMPLGRVHKLGLRPFRQLGCFYATLEAEYLGWMDTRPGRDTFIEFFTRYRVPAIPGLAEGLARIACPTAIIWGDRDRYIPFATARELVDRIPAATLTRLRGADHYIMEERPAEVTTALLELLSRPTAVTAEPE